MSVYGLLYIDYDANKRRQLVLRNNDTLNVLRLNLLQAITLLEDGNEIIDYNKFTRLSVHSDSTFKKFIKKTKSTKDRNSFDRNSVVLNNIIFLYNTDTGSYVWHNGGYFHFPKGTITLFYISDNNIFYMETEKRGYKLPLGTDTMIENAEYLIDLQDDFEKIMMSREEFVKTIIL